MKKPENNSLDAMFSADREEFAQLGQRTTKMLANYLNELSEGAAEHPIPPKQRQYLRSLPLPEMGMGGDEIISFLEQNVLPWPQPTGHPRSYGWVNSPPMPISIIAESVTLAMNSALDGFDYSGLYLMASLGRWLMNLVGFPDGDQSMAMLFSGGSAANLNALTAARYWAAREDGWNLREQGLQGGRAAMICYTSDQAHSSIQRCIEQLGLGTDNLRAVPTDHRFRMDVDALKDMIARDRQAGLRPFAVVASAGTTNVGAIDPLNRVADLCAEAGLWMHVDAAYGGFAGLDPDYADAFSGIGRADTVTIDPHKWLHVPLDCGALLTRRKRAHWEAFSLTPDYYRKGDPHDVPWPYEYMFQLTYANRSIKTWAAVARLGRSGVRELIIRCNRLARFLDGLISDDSDFERLAPTSLSVVNFRYVPAGRGWSEESLSELNEKISSAIADSGEAHIPTTKVNGKVSLRACILHYENNEDDMRHLVEQVRRQGLLLSGN